LVGSPEDARRRGPGATRAGRGGERLIVRLLSPFVAAVLGTLVLFLWWLIRSFFHEG